jgi:uncharacterized protein (TIGR02453 family)
MPTPVFPKEGLDFLRRLKRNNQREWFQPRKEEYERTVRGPMREIVLALAADLRGVAPEIVADPDACLYRIYRDTRFSADKTPYKTHAAAVFPQRGLGKHTGASLYFHVDPGQTLMAGGIYMPDAAGLLAIRRYLARNHRRFRSIVEAPEFKKAFGELWGSSLKTAPKGFPSDHPAIAYLKRKQFLGLAEFPGEFATTPKFYPTLLDRFTKALPLVRFLNKARQSQG